MDKFDKALWFEIFEKKEYSILDNFIKNSEFIQDIGGYKGFFSFYCKQINPLSKIQFFEPVQIFFDEAKILLKDFQNIAFHNFGVRSENINKDFFLENKKGMQSSLFEKNFMLKDFEKIMVNLTNFDSLLDNVDRVDLLKMDIEGAEFEIIKSLKMENIKKIKTLFFEFHLIQNYTQKDLQIALDKLSKIYKTINVLGNDYSPKLGYVLCH